MVLLATELFGANIFDEISLPIEVRFQIPARTNVAVHFTPLVWFVERSIVVVTKVIHVVYLSRKGASLLELRLGEKSLHVAFFIVLVGFNLVLVRKQSRGCDVSTANTRIRTSKTSKDNPE
jgi:hypothetical protein